MPSTEYTSRWFVAGRRNPCARNRKTFSACLVTTLKWRFGDDVLTGVKEPLNSDATLRALHKPYISTADVVRVQGTRGNPVGEGVEE